MPVEPGLVASDAGQAHIVNRVILVAACAIGKPMSMIAAALSAVDDHRFGRDVAELDRVSVRGRTPRRSPARSAAGPRQQSQRGSVPSNVCSAPSSVMLRMSPMGWLASNRRVTPLPVSDVLHDAPLAAPDHHGPVGEVARLGRAADAAAISGSAAAQDQRRVFQVRPPNHVQF